MAFIRSVATVGLLTLVSRVLGFARDLLTATLLGGGHVADAFVVAQRLPNTFRAVFAEGAMDTAFVPIYARKRRQSLPESTADFVNHIFTTLVTILLPLTVLAIVYMPAVVALIAPGFEHDGDIFRLAVTYSRIAFGFLFLISLSALQGSLLNAHGHFTPLASAPAILNIVMIAGFGVAILFNLDAGLCGSWSMIAGGIAQLVVLQVSCWRIGVAMRFSRPRLTVDVRQFFKLVGPGVIGASSSQINVLVSTMMASTLPAGAIAALYYADRLNQLPLGVIGGALSTTLLPVLTQHIAAKENAKVTKYFSRAIEISFALCLPACLILIMEAEPIVRILFQHGAFNAEHARATAETVTYYAPVIPSSVLICIFVTRFYAHEDTRTPLIVGLLSVILNATITYMFMGYWQHIGVAAAISLTAAINALFLWSLLRRRGRADIDATAKRKLPRLFLATVLMGAVLWLAAPFTETAGSWIFQRDILAAIASLSLRLIVGGCAYIAALHLTGAMRLSDLRALRQPA